MSAPLKITYVVEPDAAALAYRAAHHLVELAEEAFAARGRVRIAVSGGSTPKATFALLADPAHPFMARMPWQAIELFFVDERTVPPDNADSNYRMTKEALLDKVSIPAHHIHRMQGELEPEVAAAEYEYELRKAFRLEGAEAPRFDIITLGMGDDGHTASLFPHTAGLEVIDRLVIPNHVVQKETWRITLTAPVINQAAEVVFAVEGEGKTDVLAEVLTGPRDPERLPSQLIRPWNDKLLFLLDEAAAAKLPPAGEVFANADGSRKVGTLQI